MNDFDINLIKKYLPEDQWENAFKKLETGFPVQYIIGNVDFYNCIINVDENVLIPRFETEFLVDDLIKLMIDNGFNNPKIIEIGTGSGCISIAIKKNFPSDITAIDISKNAIDIATHNASLNNCEINFINESIENYTSLEKYDVLVSNPPYVPFNSTVDEKIKYEPQNAIYADDNGLYFYKEILKKCHDMLNKKNIIAFEIGDGEFTEVEKVAREYYPNADITLKKDLNGYERYIYIINE